MRALIVALLSATSACAVVDDIDGGLTGGPSSCGWTLSRGDAIDCISQYLEAPGDCMYVETMELESLTVCWYPEGVADVPGKIRGR